MFDSLHVFLGLALMLAVGYFLGKKIKLNDSQYALTSNLVVLIAIPSLLVRSLVTDFELSRMVSGAWYLLATVIVSIACFALAELAARLLKVHSSRKGLFCVLCALSNSMLLGVPICTGIYGMEAMPVIMYFYIVNTLFFWTYGAYRIQKDAGAAHGLFSIRSLKSMVTSPPIIAFVVGILLLALNIELPRFVDDVLAAFGSMSTPIAMIYIGMTLYRSGLKFKFDAAVAAILVFRFVISPAIMFCVLKYAGKPLFESSVMVMEAAMPVMTQACVVAGKSGADSGYAARMMALTTLACLVTSPLIAYVLPLLWK